MSGSDIPIEVEYLIHYCIDSVVLLEVLLFLRTGVDRAWTAADISGSLSVDKNWAGQRLKSLQEKGLLSLESEKPVRYRYAPMTLELSRAVDALAVAYKERRVAVTEIIVARSAQE